MCARRALARACRGTTAAFVGLTSHQVRVSEKRLEAERDRVVASARNGSQPGFGVSNGVFGATGQRTLRRMDVKLRQPWVADGACGFDECLGPPIGLVLFEPVAERARIDGDGGSRVEVALVGGPTERGAQVRQLDGEPRECLTLSRAVPQRE